MENGERVETSFVNTYENPRLTVSAVLKYWTIQ